ncbi:pyridoxamine 5'-phosphate oxidase family protein [Aliiroseovarius sp. S1339]|uniref:pyridoxamine 5'-phosphate oxidase family protein n=1 Tax=Aliiroseovarius sp. S1339 TaxID=2936990 RepID=UPI0020BE9314|nr:pyridoxamine 5'-phosphate oxidase family protein [Aliiroseovarius sp. S1339]MCK8465562.1 pyridoxamine 5'-phosphate oxidase family protein [Aliiroseovarius sp. S1339]
MSERSTSMYHDGHRELQDKFDGRRMADALEKHRRFSTFRERDVSFIESAEFFFIATAHGPSVDCSFRGGAPGFVRVTGPASLEWSDYDGNSMYRSLGNAMKSPRVGLLFIEFGAHPKRLRVNGICALLDGPTPKGHKMTVQVSADEIFPNCPRYIPDLTKAAASSFVPDETGSSAKPDWKNAEDLRGALPANDPHRE